MSTAVMIESVAIIGGGLAGFSAAQELRGNGYTGTVTIIDSGAAPYDRPPLSKDFLLGTNTLDDLQLAAPEWYVTNNVNLVLGRRATHLSATDAGASVLLDNGAVIQADVALLATGGDARRYPGSSDTATNLHVLRTIEDASRFKDALRPDVRLLIVGAGLIGAETASSAQKLGAQVTLVDPFAPPLMAAVGPELAEYLHSRHEPAGTRTITAAISSLVLSDDTGEYTGVELDTGEIIETDLILVGIGITPNIELAVTAGLIVDNGVIVDENRRSSNPRIFAAGDMSRLQEPDGTLQRRDEHWEAARLSGQAAARGILDLPATHESAHWFWSDRDGIHLEVAGIMTAPGETVIRGAIGDDSFSLFRIHDGKLLGAASINDSTAVRASRRIIAAGTPVDAAMLADPAVNLRRLAK